MNRPYRKLHKSKSEDGPMRVLALQLAQAVAKREAEFIAILGEEQGNAEIAKCKQTFGKPLLDIMDERLCQLQSPAASLSS